MSPTFGTRILRRQGEAYATRLQAGKAHGDLPLLPAPSAPQGVEAGLVSAKGQEDPPLQPGLLHKHRLHPDRGKGTPTLAAAIDRFSRYIVSWKPFGTMRAKETAVCARQAFTKHVTLSIMNFEQGGVFGSDTYTFTARLYACRAEPEQEEPDEGTMPSWRGGSRCSRANACGRRSTTHLQSLRVTTEKFVAWYSEERIHHGFSCDTPAQWYRSIICEAACPTMVLFGWEGIQKGSGFPCLTGSPTSRIRP